MAVCRVRTRSTMLDFAVADIDDGLDAQQLAEARHERIHSPAAPQIFQRVQRGKQMHALFGVLQDLHDFRERLALLRGARGENDLPAQAHRQFA